MELFTIVIGVVVITFGFLQIVLFFKLWRMTNDVARIRKYIEYNDRPNDASYPDWVIGSRVVHVYSGNQMKITSLNSNGTFVCTKDGLIAGSYRRDELMAWSEWLEHLKK